MRKLLLALFVFWASALCFAQAEIINDIEVRNNNRITKQTIITYGQIELNKDYQLKDVNEVFRNLYQTDFFENLKIQIEDNKLIIDVKENKIIQNVVLEGIKSKNLSNAVSENLFSKDKSPFLLTKVKEDVDRIKMTLNNIGYYFAEIKTKTQENDNDTITLTFEIDLGEKAKITSIEFVGDKKVKDRTLRNIIISEEAKFWEIYFKKEIFK